MEVYKYLPLVFVILLLASCNMSYNKGQSIDVDITLESSSKEGLRDKLKQTVSEKTEEPVCKFFYMEGSLEEDSYAYVFTGKMTEELEVNSFRGELWFVNGQDCILLTDEIEAYRFEPVVIEANHHLLYQTNSTSPESAKSYIWAVNEHNPQLVLETSGFCFMDHGLLASVKTFISMSAGGRVWQRDYLYWDSEKQSYRTYSKKRITEEEFLSYENAREIRDSVKIAIEEDLQKSDAGDSRSENHFEYHYLQCDNGILYVNYIITGNKDILYFYSIFKEQNGTVFLEERPYFDLYEKGYMEEDIQPEEVEETESAAPDGMFSMDEQKPWYFEEELEFLPMNEETGEEWELYRRMLEGDFSLVEDERWISLQDRYEEEIEKNGGTLSWSYFLMDFNQDGRKELCIRFHPEGVNHTACFRYEDGRIKMWGSYDSADSHGYDLPLRNGKMMGVYWYRNDKTFWIGHFDSDFSMINERAYHSGILYDGDSGLSNEGEEGEGKPYYLFQDYNKDGQSRGAPVYLSEEEWRRVEETIEELMIPEKAWKSCSVFTPLKDRPEIPSVG